MRERGVAGAVAARARARRSASATARRAATSPIARRCSTRSPRPGSSASAPSCAPPSTPPARTSEPRLHATAAAYVRFATARRRAAGADVRRQAPATGAGPLARGRRARLLGDARAHPQGQAEGALEPGDPERVGLVLFATIQGIAALVTRGMVTPEQLDELLTTRSRTSCAGRAQLPFSAASPSRSPSRPVPSRSRSPDWGPISWPRASAHHRGLRTPRPARISCHPASEFRPRQRNPGRPSRALDRSRPEPRPLRPYSLSSSPAGASLARRTAIWLGWRPERSARSLRITASRTARPPR